MTKLKKLEDFRDEIAQCVKCGACRAHCPVFGAEKREGRVARGKVALCQSLLDGQLDLLHVQDVGNHRTTELDGAAEPRRYPGRRVLVAGGGGESRYGSNCGPLEKAADYNNPHILQLHSSQN